LIKQHRLAVTATIAELVSEDPARTAFFIENIDDSNYFAIYARKEEAHGGIYLYPHRWLYFEKQDDADKQWFIKGTAGYVHIVEFYREPEPSPTWGVP